MRQTEGPVVVGINGTLPSPAAETAAIAVGARQASRRNVVLHIVVALRAAASSDGQRVGQTIFGHRILDRVTERAALDYPDLDITTNLTTDGIAGALVTASATASLIVIATDARVHYGGLLAGPVSVQVAAHALSPVLITSTPSGHSPATTAPARVVVGVDGSAAATDAIAFAFDEAEARGATLHAIYVEDTPIRRGPQVLVAAPNPCGSAPHASEAILSDTLRGWQDKFPDVAVIGEVVHAEGPVRALNAAAGPADLIVVGARGAGGFETLALGSVSDGLVRYARCSVAVVPSAAG